MRNILYSTLSTILCLLLVSACGGGGSSSAQLTPPKDSRISISAVKGVINNGVVNVYQITNGSLGELISQGTTNESGQAQLTVPGTYTGPIAIIVSAGSGQTQMKCDASGGCLQDNRLQDNRLQDNHLQDNHLQDNNHQDNNERIAFGEWYSLPSDFEMRSYIPQVTAGDHLSVSVTPLTHMAAIYTDRFPQGIDALSIESSNSQVANLFNLSGSVTEIGTLDVTDSAILNGASHVELQYAVLNAAFAQMMQGQTITQVLDDVANSFADFNGQLINNNAEDNSITLSDLAASAVSLADVLQLDSLNASLNSLLAHSSQADAGSISSAQPKPTLGLADLQKAKQLIDEMQNWEQLFNFDQQEVQLPYQLENVQTTFSNDFKSVIQALAVAGQWGTLAGIPDIATSSLCSGLGNPLYITMCTALIESLGLEGLCDEAVSDLDTYGIDICSLLNDIPLPVSSGLTVRYHIFDGAVEVSGTLGDTTIDLNLTITQMLLGTLVFSIDGAVNTENAQLTIDNGSLTFSFPGQFDVNALTLPRSARFNMDIQFAQNEANVEIDPVSFRGRLNGSIDLTELIEEEGVSLFGLAVGVFSEESQIKLSYALDGDFQSTLGSFTGNFSLDQEQMGSFNLNSEALSGNSMHTAELTLSGTISELMSSRYDSVLRYEGYQLDIDFQSDNQINIRNQDGVEIALNLQSDNSLGNITVQGSILGEFTREGDAYVVTYGDGLKHILTGF